MSSPQLSPRLVVKNTTQSGDRRNNVKRLRFTFCLHSVGDWHEEQSQCTEERRRARAHTRCFQAFKMTPKHDCKTSASRVLLKLGIFFPLWQFCTKSGGNESPGSARARSRCLPPSLQPMHRRKTPSTGAEYFYRSYKCATFGFCQTWLCSLSEDRDRFLL